MLDEQHLGYLRDNQITDLEQTDLIGSDEDVVDEIYSSLPPGIVHTENEDRSGQDRAAQLTFSLARRSPDSGVFLAASRKIMCHKATINAHDIKYPIAMIEEVSRINPAWRPHLLAAIVHFMQGSSSVECPAVKRGLSALQN